MLLLVLQNSKREVSTVNTIKIVAIGDSITYGFPYLPEQSWFFLASKEFAIEHVNSGINGDTTTGMLSRFDRDALGHKPSHVIIMGGTNDAYEGVEVSQVIDNIRVMVKLAVENGITPIIGLPIPCNDWYAETLLGEYREVIQQYAVNNSTVYIDFYSAMIDESNTEIKSGLHCDGVHPSEAGYKVMAGVAIEILRKMF